MNSRDQIIVPQLKLTEEQMQAKVESVVTGTGEKLMMRSMGIGTKVKYQKFIDETTAEVGTVASGIFLIGKNHPGNQIILKKEDSIWKYSHIMAELPIEVLIENLKNSPEDTDLYFHLARAYIPVNPAKSHRYYLKYYELNPDGFWVSEDFLKLIKEYKKEFEDTEIYEKEMLAKIDGMSSVSSKAIRYQRLCQLFMEKKDYTKANYYIKMAEDVLKKDSSEYNYWKENLDKVKTELQMHIEGKYTDILTELEARGVYK